MFCNKRHSDVKMLKIREVEAVLNLKYFPETFQLVSYSQYLFGLCKRPYNMI